MDLNQLFSSQQVALHNASQASHPAARNAHLARASGYGDRIDDLMLAIRAKAPRR